jgi:hypothetical protein
MPSCVTPGETHTQNNWKLTEKQCRYFPIAAPYNGRFAPIVRAYPIEHAALARASLRVDLIRNFMTSLRDIALDNDGIINYTALANIVYNFFWTLCVPSLRHPTVNTNSGQSELSAFLLLLMNRARTAVAV